MAEPQELRAKAERYHRLAEDLTAPADARALHELASQCEARAAETESVPPPKPRH